MTVVRNFFYTEFLASFSRQSGQRQEMRSEKISLVFGRSEKPTDRFCSPLGCQIVFAPRES